MLDISHRTGFSAEHAQFRDAVRRFFARELTPYLDQWEQERNSPKSFWRKCGEVGLLCPTVPEQYGGAGLDFRYNAVVAEELAYLGSSVALTVHSDINADYILEYATEEAKARWLPALVAGETITAIAMTEPDAGSDLQAMRTTAVRDGDSYIINGAKTYISNGQNADLVIVAARSSTDAGARGLSLFLVEADRPGFARGRKLDKIGQHSGDTSELFFSNVRIPVGNLLGAEQRGFAYLMTQLPQERLSIAVSTQAGAQRAFDEAVAFTRQRKAFGGTVLDLQNTRFQLAELKSKLQVGWAHLDWCLTRHAAKQLTAAEASAAKLFHSELLWEVCDKALQLHGGAGYMNEYPIARLWRDARVGRIYGGTSEIMKEVIARSI